MKGLNVNTNIVWPRIIAVLAALAAAPAIAAAQTPPPRSANQGGPMTVEQLETYYAVGPELRVTSLGDDTATLLGGNAGVYVGKILVGAAFYTAVNGEHHEGLTYGGGIVGWQPWASRRFGVDVRSLIGFGHGTTMQTFSVTTRDRRGSVVGTREATGLASSDLFIAEPQAGLLVGLTKNMRLNVGAGYRFANAEHVDNDRFSGATGSIALEIGHFFAK